MVTVAHRVIVQELPQPTRQQKVPRKKPKKRRAARLHQRPQQKIMKVALPQPDLLPQLPVKTGLDRY